MIYSVFPANSKCPITVVAICVVIAIQTSPICAIDTIAKVVVGGFVGTVSRALNHLLQQRAMTVWVRRVLSSVASLALRSGIERKLEGNTVRKFTLRLLPVEAPSRRLLALMVRESSAPRVTNRFRVIIFHGTLMPGIMAILSML